MFFAQYYLDCLSQASYMIADETTGKAVVVDPAGTSRSTWRTPRLAASPWSASSTLTSTRTSSPDTSSWRPRPAPGSVTDAVPRPSTPSASSPTARRSASATSPWRSRRPRAHPESISVLVREHGEDSVPYGVLTGDALFIGDVGRPDLLASIGVTADELGAMLYNSVQNKLMGLPDEVRVFPRTAPGPPAARTSRPRSSPPSALSAPPTTPAHPCRRTTSWPS